MKAVALILGLASVLATVVAAFHYLGFWGALLLLAILFVGVKGS